MWTVVGWMLVIAVGGGLIIGVLIAVPSFLYSLPYAAWLGMHMGKNGIPNDAGDRSSLFHTVANATKLYRSWLTHTPHNITDW